MVIASKNPMIACNPMMNGVGNPNKPSVFQINPAVRKLMNVSKIANGKNKLSWIGSNTVDGSAVPLTTFVPTPATKVPAALVLLVKPIPAMSVGIVVLTFSELNGLTNVMFGSALSSTKIPTLTHSKNM